jgi:hypothetical protein
LKAYSLTDDMKQRVFPEFREVWSEPSVA